ncbi:MAG: TIGR04086 family membrane protein [Oscillospiraceae bacterium]
MGKSRKLARGKLSAVSATIFSGIWAFIVVFAVMLLFAFIITKIDVGDKVVSVMSSIALCAGAYAGGYISARKRRSNGLLMGILCGLFIFLVILTVGSLFVKSMGGSSPSLKLILVLICGGIGGVVGVNSRNGKFMK